MPATLDREGAYASDTALIDPSDIGPPQLFVSHTWSNTWGLLVAAVTDLARRNQMDLKTLTCWVDIFAINQHSRSIDELDDLYAVVACSGNFVQVCDPTALPFRRVWCLFELVAWIQGDESAARGKHVPTVHVRIGTVGADGEFSPEDPKKLDALKEKIRMQEAEASVQADRALIFNMVQDKVPGGFDAVNRIIKDAVVNHNIDSLLSQSNKRNSTMGIKMVAEIYSL